MLRVTHHLEPLNVPFTAALTTGDYWEWATLPVEAAEDVAQDVALRASWLERFTTHNILETLLEAPAQELADHYAAVTGNEPEDAPQLLLIQFVLVTWGNTLVSLAGLPGDVSEGLRYLLDVSTGAIDYDPTAARKACECMACMGHAEEDEHCLLTREVPGYSVLLFNLRPILIAEYWDKPLRLYLCATALADSRQRGESVPYQKAEKKRAHEERVNNAWDRAGG